MTKEIVRPSGGGGEGELASLFTCAWRGAAWRPSSVASNAPLLPLLSSSLSLSLSNMDPVILDHNCRWLAKLGFHHFQLL